MKKHLCLAVFAFLISFSASAGESQSACFTSTGSLSSLSSQLASLNRIIATDGNNGGATSGGGGDGTPELIDGYLHCPGLREILCESEADCIKASKVIDPVLQQQAIVDACASILKAE